MHTRFALAAVSLVAAGSIEAQSTAARTIYGCYEVTAEHLNIRAAPFSSAAIVDSAARGEILAKWRRFCTLRGFWCPVQKGTARGHADKGFLKLVACPERQPASQKNPR